MGAGAWLHRRRQRDRGGNRRRPAVHAYREPALPGVAVRRGRRRARCRRGIEASVAAKLALRFLVLTATRSGEVRNAGWSEVDMDAREWRIPASRMKAGVEHRVPLNAAATAVLERARMLDDGSGLIFPSPAHRGRAMSDMTLPTRRTHPRSGAAGQRPAPFSARRCRVRFPRMGRCTESGTAGTVAVKLCG